MSENINNIRQLLAEEHSRAQANRIVDWVGDDFRRMDLLMESFFSRELRVCQRASWPLIFINQRNPNLLKPYLAKMVANLNNPLHDAVVRNTVRIFQDIEIPEEIEGELLEKCFEYINEPKCPGGIRAFSITVASKIVDKYPELKQELIISIEDHLPHASKAFVARGRLVLKALKKISPKGKR